MSGIWDAVGKGSPWFFLGIGILAIITGRLVPKSTVEARMQDKADQIKQWQAAHQMSEESRKISEQQIDKLLDQGRTTNILLSAWNKSGGGQP